MVFQYFLKTFRNTIGVLGALLLVVGVAEANVSLKNGNFFIGYTDIYFPGGFEPKIERVYNSKTNYRGMLGWGWGNEYEVYLSVSADGSVVVHEYGGGAENRFNPKTQNNTDIDTAIKTISKAAQGAGVVGTTQALAQYQKRLKNDAQFRNEEWQRFIREGRLQSKVLPNGTQLISNVFSFQYITKRPEGYVRVFETGKLEFFDDKGRLAKIQDKNNNSIVLNYGKDGRLAKVQDNFNRKMMLSFNSNGLLEKVVADGNKTATYKYNTAGELVETKDAAGNVYQYKYTKDGYHNLAEIQYADKTSQQIVYWGPEKFLNVKSVRDREGRTTVYDYQMSAGNKDHYTVSVSIKGKDGKEISNSAYSYFIKRKSNGEEWTEKMISVLDGDRTETVYDERFGLPTAIKRGAEETQFVYDPRGRVTKKVTPYEVTMLEYDVKAGKVSKVVKHPKGAANKAFWSKFQYDKSGNLVNAQNSDNKTVRLFYDMNGRIRSMVDQSKKRIDFKYNENSKPIEIIDPSIGSIKVVYTNTGEIKKVESPAGRQIASQVNKAFQNLLEIIRPAGVSLSF